MITKTNAIVLRVAPYSRTSHVVTWLTESAGRVSTVVKGAVRPKSAFLGQYDLAYTCELLFYERATNGLHLARECTPLKTRSGLRRDWQAFVAASYICDLVQSVTLPTHDGQESSYALLDEALDALCKGSRDPMIVMHWFELRLLQVLGYAPHMERCVTCGCTLAQKRAGFDAAHGGAFCLDCLPQPLARQVVAVGPDTQSVLRRWSHASAPGLLRNMVLNEKQLLALRAVTGTMLAYCLERRPESRDVAVATLGWKQGEM